MTIESVASIMQWLIYAAIAIGLGLNLYVVKKIGKGVLNVVFISLGFSLLFIGLSNAFIYLADSSFFQLEEVTFHVWWHLIMYMSFISLIWGGYRIKNIIASGDSNGFGKKDMTLFGVMTAIAALIFIIAPGLNAGLSALLTGSIIDTLGAHHLIAFLLAFSAGFYMLYIKGSISSAVGKSATFIVVLLFLFGGQHLWEILTESWKIISLDSSVIELVEQFIILPALFCFILSQQAILKVIKR